MDFATAVKEYFRRYADFNGRSLRSAFWWVMLFNFIVGIFLSLFDEVLFTKPDLKDPSSLENVNWLSYFVSLSSLYSLVTFIPTLALTVRRLHDVGKSGWYTLLVYIPTIIVIVLSILLFNNVNFQNPRLEEFMPYLIPLLVVGLIGIGLGIWLLVMLILDSERGDNIYGPNPKTGISRDDIDAMGNNHNKY